MMIKERKEYLERNLDTKGNGYYTKELLCEFLGIDELRVFKTRDGNFYSVFLWYKKEIYGRHGRSDKSIFHS